MHRRAPLLLAMLLHGGLLLALMQGLQTTERALPREMVMALLPAQSALRQPASQTPAPPPEKLQPHQTRTPVAPSPAQRQSVEPAPVAEARDTPVYVQQPSMAPAQEIRTTQHAPAPLPAPSPAPVPAAAPERRPVTVTGVEYLVPPKPDYPLGAKRAGEQGKVTLRLLIDEKGQAERVEIQQSSGYARLDEAARAAVLRAVYKPHLEDGRPVPVYVVVPISFNLR